jgi:hypothetical protein
MPDYKTPGVYVEEAPSVSRPITGVGTTIAGFVGVAPTPSKDLKEGLKAVNNWGEFKTYFGNNIDDKGDNNKNVLANAVFGFFYNGGTRCWVAHVPDLNKDFQKGLNTFKAIDEISLVAVPLPVPPVAPPVVPPTDGTATVDDGIRKQINDAVLKHCSDMKDRFAILDGVYLEGKLDASSIYGGTQSEYGAVYLPQEHISNPRRKGVNDLASIDTRKNTLLPDSKYSFGFGAPTDLALPIIASYRVFLDQDYKWILPFNEFAEDFLQHVWTNYFRKYLISEKTAGNTVGTKISRNHEIWESLYISAQSYLNQHLVKMVSSGKKREKLTLT